MRRSVFSVSCLVLAAMLSAGPSAANDSPWEAFDLETRPFEATTIHYDPELEGGLELLCEHFDALRAPADEVAAARRLLAQDDHIVDRINALVGFDADAGERDHQLQMLQWFLQMGELGEAIVGEGKAEIYFVPTEKVKAHMRAGGSLPNVSYEAETDQVQLNWSMHRRGADGETFEDRYDDLMVLVGGMETLEDDLARFFEAFGAAGGSYAGVALHEVIEWTLLARLRPRDRYFRWFSDGYADALSWHLLDEHLGREAADEFLSARDVEAFEDLRGEANLYYWPALNFEFDTPLESEARLKLARYAFAAHEALDLIETHGIGHVKAVLDHVAEEAGATRPSSRALITAYREALGEEIEVRLRRHQPFGTREQGMALYGQRYRDAREAEDDQAAVRAVIRLSELREDIDFGDYRAIAGLLHRMGHEEAAMKVFEDRIELFGRQGQEQAVMAFRQLWLVHAIGLDRPRAVYDVAEQVLAADADNVPALMVRVHRQAAEGELDAARTTAERLIELSPDPQSPGHAVGRQVLDRIAEIEQRRGE